MTTTSAAPVSSMLTYQNDATRKDGMCTSMCEHRDQDRIIHGETGRNGAKGCAVACAYQTVTKQWSGSYSHLGLADYLGVPVWIPRLVDNIFEGLHGIPGAGPDFSVNWLRALPVGADATSPALWLGISRWMMARAQENMNRFREVVAKHQLYPVTERLAKARADVDACFSEVFAMVDALVLGTRTVTAAERRAVRSKCDAAYWEIRSPASAARAVAEAVAGAGAVAGAVAEAVAEAVAGAVAGAGAFWSEHYAARRKARGEFYQALAAEFIRAIGELTPLAAVTV